MSRSKTVKTLGQFALGAALVAAVVAIPVGGYAAFTWLTSKATTVTVINPVPGRQCVVATGARGGIAMDCWQVAP